MTAYKDFKPLTFHDAAKRFAIDIWRTWSFSGIEIQRQTSIYEDGFAARHNLDARTADLMRSTMYPYFHEMRC